MVYGGDHPRSSLHCLFAAAVPGIGRSPKRTSTGPRSRRKQATEGLEPEEGACISQGRSSNPEVMLCGSRVRITKVAKKDGPLREGVLVGMPVR